MSVNAGFVVRRPGGPPVTAEEIASALGLQDGPTADSCCRTTGPDGSLFSLRLTTDPGDVSGPAVGAVRDDWYVERPYDCRLNISVEQLAGDDVVPALRSCGRWATTRLHAALEGLETAFYVDIDGNYSYRVDLPGLPEAVVDLRLGSGTPPAAPGFSLAEAANRAASGTGLVFSEDEPGRHLVPAGETGDSVTYTVSYRAEELRFAAGARSAAAPVDARQLGEFTERLLTELARHTDGADLACWVNGRLYRYEVELTPPLD
ncbi:hypothetical protein [Kitasatospora sp. NPDC096204]|uniref:hypothetical protein n=1 Tax=Kitasatospora sp. NPDC096204 TaxID=3364094 RepID=UPI003812C95B